MLTTEDLLSELEQEAQTTRRVLERVPEGKLSWRPHEKARTLGQLAMHVATVPGGVAELFGGPSPAQVPDFADPPANKCCRTSSSVGAEYCESENCSRRHGPSGVERNLAFDEGRP